MVIDQDAGLAERIRTLRTREGWTLQELADRSSVSRATLSRIENAEVSPNTQVLAKLCSAFGLTLTRLLAPLDGGFQPLVAHKDQTTWADADAGFTRRVSAETGVFAPGAPASAGSERASTRQTRRLHATEKARGGKRSRTFTAEIAYSTWNKRPSGENVLTPRSYSLFV